MDIKTLKKAIPFVKFFCKQEWYLIKKGLFKEAYNYYWAIAFTKEEGLAVLDPLYTKWHWLAPYPGRIEFEVTTACNLKCAKCEHTYWCEKEASISYENFLKIMNQFPKLKAISLSGIGHAFNHPDYFRMVDYCKEKQLYLQFFDPFLLISPTISEKLVQKRVTKIWCSLDACTEEVYNKVQANSDFKTVTKNLKALYDWKKKYNSPFPELCFHFIVTKDNVHQMADYIDFIYSLNPDKNDVKLVQFTKLIPFDKSAHLTPDIPKELVEEVEKRAKIYGNFRLAYCNIDQGKLPIHKCTAWTVPFITVEGQYYPCCAFTESNRRDHWRKALQFGNLLETDFREIWKSKKLRDFFQLMNDKKVPVECCDLNCSLFECGGCKK